MTGSHKLTPKQVVEIRTLFKTTDYSNGKIGSMYNVSDEHIRHIRMGRHYTLDNRTFVHKEELEALGLDWLWEIIVKIVKSNQ